MFFRDKGDDAGGRVTWQEPARVRNGPHLDAPVDPAYLLQIEETGFGTRICSRWFNAVTLSATREEIQRLRDLSFVREVRPIRGRRGRSPMPVGEALPPAAPAAKRLSPQEDYGPSFQQAAAVRATVLHNLGFRGEGVTIALLDAGFNHRDQRAFAHLRVKAEWDFINGDGDVSDEPGQTVTGEEEATGQNLHGTRVLSLLAGFDPGRLIGVAPEAEFVLAKTEDITSELPVDEDRWVAGLEWADSLGADIVNTSVGFTGWDDGSGYAYEDLDGQTALATLAAELAVARGIVIVAAAGNEGNKPWQYVTVPADGRGVIAVGAVDLVRHDLAAFSSHGPTPDGRIKPDVAAPGVAVVVANGASAADDRRDSFALSDYRRISGTSFAAPLVSGVSALLLQIHPGWGPSEVADALRQSAADLGAAGPDTLYGWGLVNAVAASGLDVEPTLFATSATNASRAFSGDGAVADSSSGEVTFSVFFADASGEPAADQTITWAISNSGAQSIFVLGETEVAAGADGSVTTATDASGAASITLDAEGGQSAGSTGATVTASTSADNAEGVSRDLSQIFSATWSQSLAAAPFPNPALVGGTEGSGVYFPLQLAAGDEVTVRIFDLSGNLVVEPVKGRHLEAGDYHSREQALRWDVPEWLNGGLYIYHLHLEAATFSRAGKIAIIRSR